MTVTSQTKNFLLVTASLLLLGGCGSTDSPPGEVSPGSDAATVDGSMPRPEAAVDGNQAEASLPPLDPNALVSDLSGAAKGELCDWENNVLGGYGVTTDCGNSIMVSNAANQAECVSTRLNFNCRVTVGQVETCIMAMVPSRGCMYPEAQCRPLGCI